MTHKIKGKYRRLTDQQQQALALYFETPRTEGNYAAVARTMGITRQGAKQLIERALTSLQSDGNI